MAPGDNDRPRNTTSGRGKLKGKRQTSGKIGVPTSSPHTSSQFVPPPPKSTTVLPPLCSLPHLGYNAPSSSPYYATTSPQNMHVMPLSKPVKPFTHTPKSGLPSSSSPVMPLSSSPVNPSSFAPGIFSSSYPTMSSSSIPSYHPTSPSPSIDNHPAPPSIDTDGATHPPIQHCVEGEFDQEVAKFDDYRRLIIEPDGKGFDPSNLATKAVVSSFCSFYRGAWKSWTKVPPPIRERMYTEFKTKCAWEVKHEAQVRVIFFKKCSVRMPDLLRTAREKGVRPCWILEDVWPQLVEYWGSEEFKKKSKHGKAARASTRGGSLHTGGSISMGAHRKKLERKKKRPVSQVEVFEETHIKKPKNGIPATWIEPRAERTHNTYNQLMEEFMLTQPKDDQGNPVQPSKEQIDDMWVKAADGVHKGIVYGLGSECTISSYMSRISGATSLSQSAVISQDELEQLQRTVAEFNEKYLQEKEAREEEARQRGEEMRQKDAMLRHLTSDVQSLKGQLKSLLATQFGLPRSQPSSDDEYHE